MRWAELACAAQALGLTEVIHLGYRDSGMPGSPDNQHPEALVAAPPEQVVERVVEVLRSFKPQVVITFDPIGGYRHPDHIAIQRATLRAFPLAGDPAYRPDLGPVYAPQKLYYTIFSKRVLKIAVTLMPLFGQDPRRFGKNKDIDILSLVDEDFPIDARIRCRGEAVRRRQAASAAHVSQLSGGMRWMGALSGLLQRLGVEETYMRVYPAVPPESRVQERDLFEGVQW
jgi:N-acetyl-1-D-myo-inositol-2-amino-2-deoxy-alpha-D-glucopyranoside deacetylase/mycothiol S-conjugate amidase